LVGRLAYVEQLGNNTEVAAEVAFCPLRNALAALQSWLVSKQAEVEDHVYPSNQDVLRQRRVGVLDLEEGELDAAI
jgi:hypothetical protein